ncbi:MAG TPA: bacillithiol biosynthesis deacetylase BshB1 [Thermoanaerobaculia bacterium]|nr:bacillithiol biosynthesis deacetylase BshB1 [Thermoanaerobaculia bacterium]HTR01612.1 bacillithiol biosynthesis deacetylase BshB1 [Thermoanaerobaculia bacterium]
MPVDVLAIAAHPDDVELTCGGTLVTLKSRGRRFGIVDLTHGEMGTRGDAARRDEEARRAAAILGAEFRETLDFGDGGLRHTRENELALIDVIRRERPRLVLTSYPKDRHPDHARAGVLVTDAAFYAGLRKLETRYPAHRPQQTLYFSTAFLHEPTFVVNVTAAIETRRAAIRVFSSQLHDATSREPQTMLSQQSFLDTIEARARHFGFLIGAEFGEGFVSMRPPRIDDPVEAFEGFEAGF